MEPYSQIVANIAGCSERSQALPSNASVWTRVGFFWLRDNRSLKTPLNSLSGDSASQSPLRKSYSLPFCGGVFVKERGECQVLSIGLTKI